MAEATTIQNVWLNGVNKAMIHEATNKEGKTFLNVSFSYENSANGLASVSVNEGQVRVATKRQTGEEMPNYRNVMLGKPGSKRTISVKNAQGDYDRIEVTVEEILESFKAGRAKWRAEHPQEAPAAEEEVAEETAATKTAKKATKKSKKSSK